jgi:hypothetical protein
LALWGGGRGSCRRTFLRRHPSEDHLNKMNCEMDADVEKGRWKYISRNHKVS